VHGPWTGSKTVQIWLKIEYNTFCWHPDMEIPSFPQRTRLGPVRKSWWTTSRENSRYIIEFVFVETNQWVGSTGNPNVLRVCPRWKFGWVFLFLVLSFLFKLELGISRTNPESQWNQVYKAFHWLPFCGNRRTNSSVVMQTWSVRALSRPARSTCRALLECYLSIRIR